MKEKTTMHDAGSRPPRRPSRLPTAARWLIGLLLLVTLVVPVARAADKPEEVRIDFAYYSPLSLVLKEKGWLEEDLRKQGIGIRWVQSLGSNKALEFMKAGSLDFGSTAGAAALLGRINGNPVKAVYVFSKPEWTALVTKDPAIKSVTDLKGKRVAATRGTDPHIFLVRALAANGMSEKDITLILLQHPDGRLALEKGDVDAWAGLDPLMAQAEENGAILFYRNPDANSWGILNVREEFAARYPEVVATVLADYERARAWALANPEELKLLLAREAKLTDSVAAKQLSRTDLSDSRIGDKQKATIAAAGLALQQAGVIPAEVDVKATTDALIEPKYGQALGR